MPSPAYPKTGSILNSNIHTGLSTQIIIKVNDEPVGAIQQLSETQTRGIKRITEVGVDGVIEMVPQSATEVNLQATRVAFDGLSLPEAFSRGFKNIQSQRIPFDIVVIDQQTGTGSNAVVTTYHDCWFSSVGTTYSSSDYIISQTATIQATKVFTHRGGEAVVKSQGIGGSRQVPAQIDDVELAADSGVTPLGSLDSPDLISAAF